MARYPTRPVSLYTPEITVDHRPDGSILVSPVGTLGAYPRRLTERLEHWAAAAPDRNFLAQRGPDDAWRHVSYAEFLARVRAIAQALLDRGLGVERPVAILSGNDLDHALLGFACQHVGIPYAAI